MKRVIIGMICLTALGCGSDYEPPQGTTTGVEASSLAPVFDLEFDLPQLRIMNAPQPGARVSMRIRLESAASGNSETVFLSGRALWGMQSAELVRESGLPARVLHTATALSSDGLGPFRVGTTRFNIYFDAGATDGGWNFEGTATETQSGLPGEVSAWRQRRFLVAGTDFVSNSGRIAEVAWVRDQSIEVRDGLETVSSDPVLAVAGDAVFVVNRLFFDNLQRLDPASEFRTAWQRSTSPGSNPQDVAGWGDLLFVSRYEAPFNDVAILDAQGEQILDSIPLESVAENPDSTPEQQTSFVTEPGSTSPYRISTGPSKLTARGSWR